MSPKRKQPVSKKFKGKVSSGLRKYSVPARGSGSYFEIYKQRIAVGRVNAYRKKYFQLKNIRHWGSLTKVDIEFSILSYTLCKLAVDQLTNLNVLLLEFSRYEILKN